MRSAATCATCKITRCACKSRPMAFASCCRTSSTSTYNAFDEDPERGVPIARTRSEEDLRVGGHPSLPLPVVGTVYGMNFHHNMPELHWLLGYPFAIALMIAICLGSFLMFKRRGSIRQPPGLAYRAAGAVGRRTGSGPRPVGDGRACRRHRLRPVRGFGPRAGRARSRRPCVPRSWLACPRLPDQISRACWSS